MFKVGDKVRGIDSNLEGVVVKILDTTHVMIEESDFGMEMNVEIRTLVKTEISDFSAPSRSKEEDPGKRRPKQKGERIDLHMEQIPVEMKRRNKPILQTQVEYFTISLEKAWHENSSPLLVIHGKGEGKLKTALLNVIRKDTRIKSWKELRGTLERQSSAIEIYF